MKNNVKEYIAALVAEFEENSNPKIAVEQKAYMRNLFEFYGLKSPVRKAIQTPFFLPAHRPAKDDVEKLVKAFWRMPQREYQYFAQELAFKYVRQMEENDIVLFEFMATHKSWWDTVDFIAVKLMGAYFKKFPGQIDRYVQKWIKSNNHWLQRSALLFQLKYKTALDEKLLADTIRALLGSNEFFINKAIGWVLREYSRTNPAWVLEFTDKTTLNSLSRKEALRLIK